MRILITGDRNWKDTKPIYDYLGSLPQPRDQIIIHGDARGVDRISGYVACTYLMTIEKYPADWKKYHRAAGVIRNQQMLDEGKPDVVVFFHND